jgi:membrane-associated phospholipid phosphatase
MLDTPRRLWAAAAACVASFVVLLVVVYGTESGAAADKRALEGFGELQRPRLAEITDAIAHVADPGPFALVALALVVVALLRGGPLRGLAAGTALLGANITTQILKPLLVNPRGTFGEYGVAAEAFPSGHATASMSLALVAVVVAPPRLRPLVALVGAGFALAVGFSIISLDWHFPSDVAGGYLVAAAWCFAVFGVIRTRERSDPAAPAPEERPAWRLAAATMLGALVVVGWLALERLPRITGYAEGHTTFAAVAAATAALVVVLVSAGLTVPARR